MTKALKSQQNHSKNDFQPEIWEIETSKSNQFSESEIQTALHQNELSKAFHCWVMVVF